MQRVLVTGASGFIGRHLVGTLLDRGVHVKCLVRRKSKTDHLQHQLVELVECPLENTSGLLAAMDGVDVVFHLAGLRHSPKTDRLYQVNGEACGQLADACRQASEPPTLIYVSSLAAAGPTPETGSVQEEQHVPQPISDYGKSKRKGELEVEKRAGDLPCTIIRPGIVFGSYDPGMAAIYRSIYRFRLHFTVGFRTPPLSLIHVDDLVQIILATVERGERVEGGASEEYSPVGFYNACDDSEHPDYRQLGKLVARVLDRRMLVVPLWRWEATLCAQSFQFACALFGQSSVFNADKIREAKAASWACSSAKARSQLGFQPAGDLESSLKETGAWYLENGWI